MESESVYQVQRPEAVYNWKTCKLEKKMWMIFVTDIRLLKLRPPRSPEISKTNHPATQRNGPTERLPQFRKDALS